MPPLLRPRTCSKSLLNAEIAACAVLLRPKRLAFNAWTCSNIDMGAPCQPITLSPEQVESIRVKLSTLRHNVNNYATLIMAAAELIRRKPDQVVRFTDSLVQQPDRITQEIRAFSDELERALQISQS